MTNLQLNDAETAALTNLLTYTIEGDRYPLSPRMQTLRGMPAAAVSPGPVAAETGRVAAGNDEHA